MADVHLHLDECPDCGGPQATTMTRIPGIESITLHDEDGPALTYTGRLTVSVGPMPGPCPNTPEAGRG